MTVKNFVKFWNVRGFNVRVRTVGKVLTWCFTSNTLTFFIPASAIIPVADAIAKYGKA